MTFVTAVVVTYDRGPELRQVIGALRNQSRPLDRVIVVDNYGPVPACEVLAEEAQDILILRTEANEGGAGGFAYGVEAALVRGTDWIWLLDDDAVPRPAALAELLDASEASSHDTAVLSPAVYENGVLATEHQRLFDPVGGYEPALAVCQHERKAVEIDLASFVGFFVRSSAVWTAGLPDAAFFISYDDTEYSLRLRRRGWRLFLITGAKIDHLKLRSARLQENAFGIRHYYDLRNRIVVAGRYAARPTAARLRATCIGLSLFRISRKSAVFSRSSVWLARAIWSTLR